MTAPARHRASGREPGPRYAPALATLAVVLLGSGAVVAVLHARQETFPHVMHEGLFPVCQGCHAGIEAGNEAAYYPDPDRCTACHDGVRAVDVEWAGPTREPTNLSFSHVAHGERLQATGDTAACPTCHRPEGATARMVVRPATPDRCTACHGHDELEHPDGGQPCTLCHVPLTEAPELATTRIASFPRPSSHEDAGFLSGHGPDLETVRGRCATCHARPSCERCHVNAEALQAVQALEPDARVRELTADLDAEYPTPASHEAGGWIRSHGPEASGDPGACANCHARPGCLACHRAGAPAVDALFDPRPGGPRGVELNARDARDRVHPAGFAVGHAAPAATGSPDCASCHEEAFCSTCHAGPDTPGFHAPNFLETHGAPAFGAEIECTSCHNPELFCRSCHAEAGLASSGRLNAGFHDAQPFWLLGHGQAARQNLEGCVTCHAQTDCATCHSPLGGWGVNPHGPGFEPSRYGDGTSAGCILCHRSGIPPS